MTFKFLPVKKIPTRSPSTRIEWDVTVSSDVTVNDLLVPSYWSSVSGTTFNGANNLVTVYWEDKSQLATLYVQHYDHAGAIMKLLSHHVFDQDSFSVQSGEFEVKWINASRKFGVYRIADQFLIKDGIRSKDEANKFIEEYKHQ